MREKWYGDQRDLAKWATLLELAREAHVEKILQVTCLVPDGHKRTKDDHAILTKEFGFDVADVVWRHFRTLDDVVKLGREVGIEVVVVPDEYPNYIGGRDSYFESIAKKWLRPDREPLIVFLDPDTGLGRGRTHVSPEQLVTVRRAMKPGDCLVFYQHAPLFETDGDWRVDRHRDFAEALDVPADEVAHRLSDVAKDVMFLVWSADGAIEGNRGGDARDQAPPPRASGLDEPEVGLRDRAVGAITRRLRDLLDR